MAHLVDTMAYRGNTPWHGLGDTIPQNANIEQVAQASGLIWAALEMPVYLEGGVQIPGYKALVRSDTKQALSIMSERYKTVQPREILEFYRDLTENLGYTMETAGSLKGGRKIWALAKTPDSITLPGDDKIEGYLLLATSLDGTLSTVAKPTSVRVVCNNTLQLALQGEGGIRTNHNTTFDPRRVKDALGLVSTAWGVFADVAQVLATRKVTAEEVVDFMGKVVFKTDDTEKLEKGLASQKGQQLIHAIKHSPGANLPSAQGTAWGILNGLTHWLDHTASRSQDNRLNSAWFGAGAATKQNAVDFLMGLRTEMAPVEVVHEASAEFFASL